MSYSFMQKCFECQKGGEEYKSECIDKIILQNAINSIHQIGNQRGHLGAGVITLECQYFVEKEQ